MNKLNLLKKFIVSSLVIFYDIISLFWCYVIIKSMIFELSTVAIGTNGIEVIGGADIPTLIYKMGNILGCVFPILFVLLSIATVFLFTVSIIQKQTNRKFKILLCIFLALTLIIYMLIPAQTYIISLYILIRKFSLAKYLQIIYIVISFVIIMFYVTYFICNKYGKRKVKNVQTMDID